MVAEGPELSNPGDAQSQPAGHARNPALPTPSPRLIAVKRLAPWLLVLLVVAGAAAGYYFHRRSPSLSADPLANIPERAVAVARIDVPALRSSTLWQRFVVEAGGEAGIERIREQCGIDPLQALSELVVFVDAEEATMDHVVFVARGEFDHEALGRCIEASSSEEGIALRETTVDGVPAIAGQQGDSRLLFFGTTGMVLGSESSVREVLRVVRGDAASLRNNEAMATLWDEVGGDRQLRLVANLPAPLRRALGRHVAPHVGSGISERLESVERIALGAQVSRGLSFGIALRCDEDPSAAALGQALQRPIANLLRNPIVALSPAGPALRRIRIEAQRRQLHVAGEYTQEHIDRLLELLGSVEEDPSLLRGAMRRPSPPPAPAETPAPTPTDPGEPTP